MSNPLMEKMLDLPEFEVTDFKPLHLASSLGRAFALPLCSYQLGIFSGHLDSLQCAFNVILHFYSFFFWQLLNFDKNFCQFNYFFFGNLFGIVISFHNFLLSLKIAHIEPFSFMFDIVSSVYYCCFTLSLCTLCLHYKPSNLLCQYFLYL